MFSKELTSLLVIAALFANVVIILVVLQIISRKQVSKRASAHKDLASQWLFTYTPHSSALTKSMQRSQLSTHGQAHAVINLLSGSRKDIAIQLFDYSFTIGAGSKTQRGKTSVIALRSPRLQSLHFTLHNRNIFEGIKQAVGQSKAIELTGNAAFNKKYIVTGETTSDELLVQTLFDTEVQEFLLEKNRLTLESDGEKLLVYRKEIWAKPEGLHLFLAEALEVVELFSAETNR